MALWNWHSSCWRSLTRECSNVPQRQVKLVYLKTATANHQGVLF